MASFNSSLDYRDKVYIDGDRTILGTVLSFQFRTTFVFPNVEVSWLHNGAVVTQWFEEWRLTKQEA